MAIPFTPASVSSGFQSTETLNANFEALETALQDALSRSGDSPNDMETDLDMQAHRIYNLPNAVANGEPVTYQQWTSQLTTVEFAGYLQELHTATASQTEFTLGNAYTPGLGALRVFVNGLHYSPSEYTETDANTVTFGTGLEVGDEVAFIITSFTAADYDTASTVQFLQAGTGAAYRSSQDKMREVVSVTDFGAVGDGSTDDTAAFVAAFAAAASIYVPIGTWMVTGLTLPQDCRLYGQNKDQSIIKLIDGTDPTAVITVSNTRCSIEDLTINGNRDNNATGIGVDGFALSADPAHFFTMRNVFVTSCAQEGVKLRNANASSLRDVSITRCTTCLVISRCRGVHMSNVDLAKFTVSGLLLEGGSTPIMLTWNGGFMEATADEPAAGAPFIHYTGAIASDSIRIAGVYMYGHDTDLTYDTTGVHIDAPTFVDNFVLDNVLMRDITTAALYTSVQQDEIGYVDFRGVRRSEATPAFTRQIGVLTEDSYEFEYFTDGIDLTSTASVTVYPFVEGAPLEITEFTQLVTTTFNGAGNGTLLVGYADDNDYFASLTLTNATAAGALTNFVSSFTRARVSLSAITELTFAASVAFGTAGAAKYKFRGWVF